MENYGLPPPPKGMLIVKLKKIDNLKNSELIGKSDPYVQLQVRTTRYRRSKTIANSLNPEYNETFNFIVDDFEDQQLHFKVYDDEFGWKDELLSVCTLPFVDETSAPNDRGTEETTYKLKDFIRIPRQEYDIELDLRLPEESGILGSAVKMLSMTARTTVLKPAKTLFRKKTKETDDGDQAQLSNKEKLKKEAMRKSVGKVHFSVKFVPFSQPDEDEDEEDAEDDEAAKKEKQTAVPGLERQVTFNITDDLKGLLTVQVMHARNLVHTSGSVDPYVELRLSDPDPLAPKEEVVKTRTVFNDDSPRWGDKFDFVNISAKSELFIVVYDKKTMTDRLFSLSVSKARFADSFLGKVKIPIYDVARNGTLRDNWVLQDVESGEIELRLDWVTVYTDE